MKRSESHQVRVMRRLRRGHHYVSLDRATSQCLAATARGARHAADAVVMMRRAENPKATTPATRLEVLISDSPRQTRFNINDCRGTGDVELEVPRGATVYVKTREGDIEISDVAEVHAETSSGNIACALGEFTEATSVSGDCLGNSNGRVAPLPEREHRSHQFKSERAERFSLCAGDERRRAARTRRTAAR